jgi:ABC-2 type transport system permease protein
LSDYFLIEQLSRSLVIIKKNIRVYYSKAPVVIFGLITPFFLLLSFYIGRNIPAEALITGLLGMTAFFTATSVGPAITPWEAMARTLERLVSAPISTWALFLGDVLSSFLFGVIFSSVPLIIGGFIGVEIVNPLILGLAIIVASFCFASFSILLSAYPPANSPATIMMQSSLVKFTLVFISGIFIPLEEMPLWGKSVSLISPLTYFVDLAKYSLQGNNNYPIALDFTVLITFAVIFLVTAVKIHERTMQKRL